MTPRTLQNLISFQILSLLAKLLIEKNSFVWWIICQIECTIENSALSLLLCVKATPILVMVLYYYMIEFRSSHLLSTNLIKSLIKFIFIHTLHTIMPNKPLIALKQCTIQLSGVLSSVLASICTLAHGRTDLKRSCTFKHLDTSMCSIRKPVFERLSSWALPWGTCLPSCKMGTRHMDKDSIILGWPICIYDKRESNAPQGWEIIGMYRSSEGVNLCEQA